MIHPIAQMLVISLLPVSRLTPLPQAERSAVKPLPSMARHDIERRSPVFGRASALGFVGAA
jgi:hypothetical protein